MNILFYVALLFTQITPAPKTVTLTWEPYYLARPSNAGWYRISRQAKVGDFCAGDYVAVGFVAQKFDVSGNAIAPTFIDATPFPVACYVVSYNQTPSGTPNNVETEISDPISVTVTP